jgi:hypothetical protein
MIGHDHCFCKRVVISGKWDTVTLEHLECCKCGRSELLSPYLGY